MYCLRLGKNKAALHRVKTRPHCVELLPLVLVYYLRLVKNKAELHRVKTMLHRIALLPLVLVYYLILGTRDNTTYY